MLNVPPPSLPASPLALEKPVEIALLGPTFSDGAALSVDDVLSIGALVFRGAPGAGEVWDEGQRNWRANPSDDGLMALAPIPAVAGDAGWKATLIAFGKKDAAAADVYAAASGGSPSYHLRALVRAARDGAKEAALSAPSAPFTFASDAEKARFAIMLDTPTTLPDQAHRVLLQLKGDALQPAGFVEIRAAPGFEVEIANCDPAGNPLARVLLLSNGAIQLRPGFGQRVVIDGDVETGRLLYQPAGGGSKHWLM